MSSGEDPLREPQGQVTGGGEVEESNLGPTPTLGLEPWSTSWKHQQPGGVPGICARLTVTGAIY